MAWSLTAPAKGDLDDIWWYIAQEDVTAADKMISRLVARFDMLARQPLIGETCPAFAANLRNFPVRPYVIYSSVEDDRSRDNPRAPWSARCTSFVLTVCQHVLISSSSKFGSFAVLSEN